MDDRELKGDELEKAKLLLWSLLQDCGRRMEKAEATRDVLNRNLEQFRTSFTENLGHMNLFRQEEMRARLREVEREAREFDVELAELRSSYDRMYKEYSKLCE